MNIDVAETVQNICTYGARDCSIHVHTLHYRRNKMNEYIPKIFSFVFQGGFSWQIPSA